MVCYGQRALQYAALPGVPTILFSISTILVLMKAALILAGGKAARFHGEKKGFVLLKRKPLIQWVIETVTQCVDELILSGDDDLHRFGYPVVQDHFSDVGPLAGFHAGFSVIQSEYTFVTGCDMPFIKRDIISYLFEKAQGYSCCVPRQDTFIEPLCCVYRTADVNVCCHPLITQGKKRIWDLIQCLPRPRFVSFNHLRSMDPYLVSFKNCNTEKDITRAELMDEIP
jgi:molybdopterin-guanine dinucleotide biosynthesis protein A